MPFGRIRERDLRYTDAGYVQFPPSLPSYISSYPGKWEKCWDTVGNYPNPNDFYKITDNRYTARLDGEWWRGDPEYLYEIVSDVPVTGANRLVPEPWNVWPQMTLGDKSNAAWEILAGTNPNSPALGVPTFIGELKDIPSLVKDWGGSLLKKIAKGHVTWRWAVKPMINDIRTMCSFVDNVDDTIRWLLKARDGETLKRHCGLGSETIAGSWGVPYTIHSATCIVKAKERVTHTMKMWGSAHYELNNDVELPKTSDGLAVLALRLTYGINSYALLQALWELLPWSWFIDWFVGVGDVLTALNNTIGMHHTQLCVMRTLTSRREYQFTSYPSWITLSGEHYEERERKERYVVTPLLPFPINFPFLDGGKWSILGSLAALKWDRKR